MIVQEVNNQQSTIDNQQSTINNQQSTIPQTLIIRLLFVLVLWENRDNFVKQPGRYSVVEIDDGHDELGAEPLPKKRKTDTDQQQQQTQPTQKSSLDPRVKGK
jgi:hypothetical protein